ncbi:hypothetical protein A2635_03125 [Candidatus Peribacteria bacterium RIFCSPHIGHO2_01_FULL_51_9]|nr:MAG: hypothetical protein A2635_03125 [Candidatus Peribacteria bacterium RIFCSPHIGHO2_01_FULL_51_9]
MDRFDYDDAALACDKVVKEVEKRGLKPDDIQEGLILGSGLGGFVDERLDHEKRVAIPFWEILGQLGIDPGSDSVKGHSKELVIAPLKGDTAEHPVLIMAQSGREHLYQGIHPKRATFWLRVMQLLGVKVLGGSTATGVVTPETIRVPQIVLIHSDNDDIGDNPLIGHHEIDGNGEDLWGPRFPHLNEEYPEDTRGVVKDVAKKEGIRLAEGLYIRTPTAPCYERPEDVYRMRTLARDIWREGGMQRVDNRFHGAPTAVVGMSTTYEAIVAQHATQSEKHPAFRDGRFFLAAATDYAGALDTQNFVTPPTHAEVEMRAGMLQENFAKLVRGTLLQLREQRKKHP